MNLEIVTAFGSDQSLASCSSSGAGRNSRSSFRSSRSGHPSRSRRRERFSRARSPGQKLSRPVSASPRISSSKKYSRSCDRWSVSSRINSEFVRHPQFCDLPLEWWEREEDCKDAKAFHTEKLDRLWPSREDLILQTTLHRRGIAMEKNMFPYATPAGIEHYTLWSRQDLNHREIVSFIDNWLLDNHPQVRRWQYDDNSGERSILLFHVHVFVEFDPFCFTPRPGLEYFPPHCTAR